MRIIAGKYRGRKLKSPPSLETRPTSDRLRETLFNILTPRIAGTRFLDLCAGSGAVGIEALSRGADHVTFVDRSRRMCALIEENLRSLAVPNDQSKIACTEAEKFLNQDAKSRTAEPLAFDTIFFDPPYASDYEVVLNRLGDATSNLLAESGLVIAEHYHKDDLPEAAGVLRLFRLLKQGDSALSFYVRGDL